MTFLLDALAAFRLTRLVTEDAITEPLRKRIVAQSYAAPGGIGSKVHKLIECPWCAGFWISAGVIVARAAAPRAWEPVARVLALSAAVGLIAENLD